MSQVSHGKRDLIGTVRHRVRTLVCCCITKTLFSKWILFLGRIPQPPTLPSLQRPFPYAHDAFNNQFKWESCTSCRNSRLFYFLAATANRIYGQRIPAGHHLNSNTRTIYHCVASEVDIEPLPRIEVDTEPPPRIKVDTEPPPRTKVDIEAPPRSLNLMKQNKPFKSTNFSKFAFNTHNSGNPQI